MMGFARYGGFERGVGGGMFLFMGLTCLLFFIALIVWIVRMAMWRRHGMGCGMGYMRHMHGIHEDHDLMQGNPDEALDILRRRFAGGDITKEEYEERLKVLNGEK